jgi:hypothetical protein
MPVCSACSVDLPKANFSKVQANKPATERRCKECVLKSVSDCQGSDENSQSLTELVAELSDKLERVTADANVNSSVKDFCSTANSILEVLAATKSSESRQQSAPLQTTTTSSQPNSMTDSTQSTSTMETTNTVDSSTFELQFKNSCSASGTLPYRLSKVLMRIVQAWTQRKLGGVVLANPSQTKFIAIEFFGPSQLQGKPAVQVELVCANSLQRAQAFLAGETLEVIHCFNDAAYEDTSRHIMRYSNEKGSLVDLESGCPLLEGLILPA